ncbi:ferritin-like domain-containing protein [Desulfonatronum thioautotrophicum]|uniref:ferritin-like domain-containing protein n=1 Tax=Desulfonatronum thioautotrophicum TaxID=617001 RepID=UPI0012946599|nr:ferritin-like domain-containing protein [Desulfonatronum thioautotrophicum]
MGRSRTAQAEVEPSNGYGSLEELMALALQHEHGAMVQYANHAGLLSHWINPIFATSIQDIIADEVEHAVTLVNALAVRDVTPTLAVWPPRSGNQARELILMDIAAEQGAVELYSEMLEYDLDPALRTAITRIRDAEILHRNIFNDLLEKV